MARMDELPQEIYQLVAYLLQDEPEALYGLALTSRAWRPFATEVWWKYHGDTTFKYLHTAGLLRSKLQSLLPKLTLTDDCLPIAWKARASKWSFTSLHTLVFRAELLDLDFILAIPFIFWFPNIKRLVLLSGDRAGWILDSETVNAKLPKLNSICFGKLARETLLGGVWLDSIDDHAVSNLKTLEVGPFVDVRTASTHAPLRIASRTLETVALDCHHRSLHQMLPPSDTIRHLHLSTRSPNTAMFRHIRLFTSMQRLVIKFDGQRMSRN